MHAYAIQPSAGLVKLDAMENPFRLPPELQRELGERLGRVAINRYPAQCVADVVAALAALRRAAGRLQADARQRLRRVDRHAGAGLRRAGRDGPRAAARLRDVRDVGAAAGPALRRRAADAGLRARRGRDAGGDRAAPAGDHLHRLPEQPDRQPVGRRGDRPHRRRRGRAGRPGGVRRGLPAVLVAQLDAAHGRARACAGDAHAEQVRPGRRAPGLPVRRRGADRRDRQGAPAVQRQRAQCRGDAVRARACRRVRAPGRASCARARAAAGGAARAAGRARRSRARPT